MVYTIPPRLVKVITEYLAARYLPEKIRRCKEGGFNKKDIAFFARGAGRLSEAFTIGRSLLPKDYFNLKEYRTGYILYFLIPNYLKLRFCLSEAGHLKEGSRILDIGAGPATTALAASDISRDIEIVAVDRNRHILEDGMRLVSMYARGKVLFKSVCMEINPKSIRRFKFEPPFDHIILSNVLSEMGLLEERKALIFQLMGMLKDDGTIILIEPALQKTTRELMRLRDLVVAEGVHVVSPCLGGSSCPMLVANKRDWCHMYLEWERPEIIEEVDRLIGNKKDYIKFSYLILSRRAVGRQKGLYRVVSSPIFSKGRIDILLCGGSPLTLERLVELEREKRAVRGMVSLADLKRGELVLYDGRTLKRFGRG